MSHAGPFNDEARLDSDIDTQSKTACRDSRCRKRLSIPFAVRYLSPIETQQFFKGKKTKP